MLQSKRILPVRKGLSTEPEYNNWSGMKARCYNKNHPKYPRYGGRGITVCERWLGTNGFENFVNDVGRRPSLQHSINRINNDGNYEPSNCEWASPSKQATNRSNSLKNPGVYYDKNPRIKSKWYVLLSLNRKIVYYGRFKTEEEAIAARKGAEKKYLT